jgi:hypothetical protein
MSRLDDHVRRVRVKMAFAAFTRALPWTVTALTWAVLLFILIEKYTPLQLYRTGHGGWFGVVDANGNDSKRTIPLIWCWIALAIAFIAPAIYAFLRRPSKHQAAVAIDEQLGLKEKFSTALYVRSSEDPFAAATVRDAEAAASGANLHRQFPIRFPARAVFMLALWLAVAGSSSYLPPHNLFAKSPPPAAKPDPLRMANVDLEHRARQALAALDTAPRQVIDNEQLKMAQRELKEILKKPIDDVPGARKRAEEALRKIEDVKKKIEDQQKFVTSNEEKNILKNIGAPSVGETGPIADAHRAFAEGKLAEAADELKDAVDKFDKMNQEEKDKAAKQMENLANAIEQKAKDPKVQENIQKELEKAGVDKQQAQQIAQKMKDAANGDKNAQQQLQQLANQAIQQNNQRGGQSQKQQQAAANAIRQAMQQGQQQANGQASAQQMAQTAKGLSQAMAQAAQQGAGKNGQQQANAGQGGQQPGPGQGNQPGQNGAGQGNAMQQMQQQAGQLQAMAKDAQGAAAGQQMAGGQQGQPGNNPGPGQGGQGQAGNQQGIGMGGVGVPGVATPYRTKAELAPTMINEQGKMIASDLVNVPSERGESHATISRVVVPKPDSGENPVNNERIPKPVQQAVKDYFDTLKPDRK